MSHNNPLSKTGHILFNQAYKPKINRNCIKSIIHNLFTSKYDKEIQDTCRNMKGSSLKIYEYIHNLQKIKNLNRTAIYNIILLIFTNGEHTITPQKVKFNIGFYLNLAIKAMKNDDHQTAVIIKASLENKYISKLNIKYNKSMIKKIELLNTRYGYYSEFYIEHICEMYTKYNTSFYIPSSLVLNLNISRHFENKTLCERNSSSHINYKLHEICSVKHNFFKNTKTNLCPIYYTDTLTLAVTQNILDAKYLTEDKDEIIDKILNKYHNYFNYLLHLKN
jgi:hypothetical protein